MKRFHHWSIRYKLTALFAAIACMSAIMVAVPMGVFDFLGLKRAMAKDLASLADALGRNSTAALAFHDGKSAQDVLEALRAEPSVTAACIYTEDGKPFAKYVRNGNTSSFTPPLVRDPVTSFQHGRLIQFRKIVFAGESIGTIYIESDLDRLNDRLREYTVAFLINLGVTLAVALLVASRLQRPISTPLLKLVATAGAISKADDYSIRAELANHDEFGLLVSAFNGMLDQIEKRDHQLRRHRERLEQEVASRTAELRLANTQLREAEEKYRTIFEDAVIGIFQATPDGRPIRINRAMAQLHGYECPEQLLAHVGNVVQEFFVHPNQMAELLVSLQEKGVVRSAELELYRKDGSKKWVLANIRAVRDTHGGITLLEGTLEDITEQKLAQEQVHFLAYYDALTGLPNRTLLQDRLAQCMALARRQNDKLAVLFLDLDRFKVINDSLGHSFGDLLLQDVAQRLKSGLRQQDTIARIGGDEFLIVLGGLKDIPSAAVAAERVMDLMSSEFIIQGRSFTVNCSIGISIYPQHGSDGETLIKNADAAMYCAKENGRNGFQFFTDDMNTEVMERLELEHNLRQALEDKQLFLLFQPQMEVASGQIIGMEGLLRWKHPQWGLVPPDKFIRVAENSGLILPIGEWVLKTACLAARRWQDMGLPPVPVAVNVSAVQFRQETFGDLVRRILRESRLAPEYLELELTEGVLLSSADIRFAVLQGLKRMGVKLAIDDFGTGYSNLSYLRQFPVQKLKIDRSFIKSVAVNPDDAAITAAIIGMAKSLNLRVIAEGVENEEQMAFLRAHQCDEIQGYYFSKPLTCEEIEKKLRSSAAAASPVQPSNESAALRAPPRRWKIPAH
jgi:diguanylate cyclase (GGDEF)-like protein/PAS domain S-box-containing protein